MDRLIHILHLEDDLVDAELIRTKIEDAGLSCRINCVQTRVEFDEALHQGGYDVILADYQLPMYDGMSALRLAQELCPEVPFIFVSGTMGEDAAIEGLTEGATDYVLKQKMSRLVPAIKRALHEAENWRERKRAEEALRTSEARLAGIIESAMDAIISMDDKQRIVLFNAAAERTFGRSAAEMLGQPFEQFIPKRFRQRYGEQLYALDQTGASESLSVVVGQRTGGEEFPIEASISRIETAGGKLYTIILRDITRRKQAEAARLRLEERLRQAQKMESIGRLASGVAHDFSNVLTVIRGYVDQIQYKIPSDDPLAEDLEYIRQASDQAVTLTRQLLAFSRQQVLTPIVLDLNSLMIKLTKILKQLAGEDVTLSTALQPELWCVTADPSQIERVIMNLVVNARDAMPTGGKITIETSNVYLTDNYAQTHFEVSPGPYVMLAVTDTGHGMDKATQARIFEPFFTTKEQGKGTGLGLATVYGVVKQSGGDIIVESAPGQGTTFKIYLSAIESIISSMPQTQSAS